MKKGDIIIIFIALILAGLLYFGYNLFTGASGERMVTITVNQTVIKTVELTEDTQVKYLVKTKDGEFIDIKETDTTKVPDHGDGYDYNIVYIHDNGVEVIDADCPNKIDVKQGFVKMSNLPIVCIPHKLSVMIEPSDNNLDDGEHDAVVLK